VYNYHNYPAQAAMASSKRFKQSTCLHFSPSEVPDDLSRGTGAVCQLAAHFFASVVTISSKSILLQDPETHQPRGL